VVFAISAILSLAAAVAAVTLLRHLRPADPEEEQEAQPDASQSGGFLVADPPIRLDKGKPETMGPAPGP
jgi:hypothetical protein